ncbi:WD40 repeat-like protein [Meira miltonrushii]|uniref:WD40 repeat-like protein n=1 Tax=Meira miltonrushii TaxID=1280837 RepID=A0A316VQ87_9BASI|nr:WD40 repeat-like protein [Meira miltonrushii]PWN37655.1 WD40 repeat-like protein [Meira miltonrushii]
MTNESIVGSRPRRATSKRVQPELYTRNAKRKAVASSSRTRLSESEDEGEDVGSSDAFQAEDATSGPEEMTSEPEEEEMNGSVQDDPIYSKPVQAKMESTPARKIRGRQSGPARAQHRFPHSFTNAPQQLQGIVPDADSIHQGRKEESQDSKTASLQVAAMVKDVLKKGKRRTQVLPKRDAQKYSKGKKMTGEESYLKPTEETFAAVEEGTELVSDVNFTELLPFIGDRLSVEMGTENDSNKLKIQKDNAIPLNEATKMSSQQGVLLNVGSQVYSVDWSYKADGAEGDNEYLCVSAALDEWPRTRLIERVKKGSQPGVLQIWSISKKDWRTKLEMKLCFDAGRMSVVRWVPISDNFTGANASIGLLSVTMQDGNIEIYSVPRPDTLSVEDEESVPFIKLDPLLVFRFSEGIPLCMEWQDSQLLAVGYSDGHVAVWNLRKGLGEQQESIKDRTKAIFVPDMCIRASRSPIADLTWGKKGENELYIAGYDGSVIHTTLSNADFCQQLIRSRDTSSAITFEQTTNLALYERLKDCCIQTVEFPQKSKPSSRLVYPHYGRIRCLHTSPHHPFLASGGADGTVRIGNVPALMLQNTRRWASGGTHTIFRLDFPDRGSNGPVRFIEPLATFDNARFPPDGLFASAKSSKFSSFASKQGLTMAWHPAVNVTCVRWNLNSRCETWLASGMAVGLVRIDVVGKPSEQESDGETEGDV